MNNSKEIKSALKKIFKGIEELKSVHPGREFTVDGRLVGDIGEMLAELYYDIELDEIQQPDHDGTTSDNRRVQVKATFKDKLTFRTTPQLYLGLKLCEDGRFDEIYSGPPEGIVNQYRHRKGFGTTLLSFPIKKLKELSNDINEKDRILRKNHA